MNEGAAVVALLERAVGLAADDVVVDELHRVLDRLDQPLRVALIGRAKAGKSTLLNALVGDLVAPTDAAECTLIPTEYHDGVTYRAWRLMVDGSVAAARFERDVLGARIHLDGVSTDDVVRLLVEFPSARLRDMTVLDTPGLGSIRSTVSRRTVELTAEHADSPPDAVVYLLRNWHTVDSQFLTAFHEQLGVDVPPVNAVAVLSRADEIGGGGADALDLAHALADALANEPTVRSLVLTVVPIAGLLAQTAITLTQADFHDLVTLASAPLDDLEAAMLSADRFTAEGRLTELAVIRRRSLLARFGLFGLRFAIEAVRLGTVTTAQALATELVQLSGLAELRNLIFERFGAQATILKSAQALELLEQLLADGRVRWDADLADGLERLNVSAHELTELKMLNDVLSSTTLGLAPAARTNVARLLGAQGVGPVERLGIDPVSSTAEITARLLEEIRTWQARASSTASRPEEQRLARVVVRSLTPLLAQVKETRP